MGSRLECLIDELLLVLLVPPARSARTLRPQIPPDGNSVGDRIPFACEEVACRLGRHPRGIRPRMEFPPPSRLRHLRSFLFEYIKTTLLGSDYNIKIIFVKGCSPMRLGVFYTPHMLHGHQKVLCVLFHF